MHGYSGMGEGWVLYSYPIHMAVSQDNVSFLRLLLKHGADPLKEYSDFNSLNKYQTTIALLEAAKKKKHLHTAIMLQVVSTLEKRAFGMNDVIFEHIRTVFLNIMQQENSELLLDLIIELAGSLVTKNTAYTVADPGFSPGEGANSQKCYYFSIFCQKLHENERIWTPGGGRASLAPPLGSANGTCQRILSS